MGNVENEENLPKIKAEYDYEAGELKHIKGSDLESPFQDFIHHKV